MFKVGLSDGKFIVLWNRVRSCDRLELAQPPLRLVLHLKVDNQPYISWLACSEYDLDGVEDATDLSFHVNCAACRYEDSWCEYIHFLVLLAEHLVEEVKLMVGKRQIYRFVESTFGLDQSLARIGDALMLDGNIEAITDIVHILRPWFIWLVLVALMK